MFRRNRILRNKTYKKPEPKQEFRFISDYKSIPYRFDMYGKPTMKKWLPNVNCKLDDFGETNYNTQDMIYCD